MATALQTAYLRDYLRSPGGIHEMFGLLGYQVFEPEPLGPEDLDLNASDTAAVEQVYIVTDPAFGHTVWLDASILGEAISTRSLEQLRRLRDEDQAVIDDLERDIELVSTDEMKFPLIVYLQQMGMEKVQNIPRGIGSGIAHTPGRPSGVFFAFQSGDRHFWRLYVPYGKDDIEVITDKRRIYRYLQVMPDEKRVMPPDFEVYDWLDQATNDVIKEINAALREKVQQVVQNVPLDPFRKDRDLKQILADYQQHGNQRVLVEALNTFFVENELYRDVVTPRSTLDHINTENLQLIAYEVFG